jgi:hypothetical protein
LPRDRSERSVSRSNQRAGGERRGHYYARRLEAAQGALNDDLEPDENRAFEDEALVQLGELRDEDGVPRKFS